MDTTYAINIVEKLRTETPSVDTPYFSGKRDAFEQIISAFHLGSPLKSNNEVLNWVKKEYNFLMCLEELSDYGAGKISVLNDILSQFADLDHTKDLDETTKSLWEYLQGKTTDHGGPDERLLDAAKLGAAWHKLHHTKTT